MDDLTGMPLHRLPCLQADDKWWSTPDSPSSDSLSSSQKCLCTVSHACRQMTNGGAHPTACQAVRSDELFDVERPSQSTAHYINHHCEVPQSIKIHEVFHLCCFSLIHTVSAVEFRVDWKPTGETWLPKSDFCRPTPVRPLSQHPWHWLATAIEA